MKDVFFKKYWAQKGITYYMHFKENMAVRQIEIGPNIKKFLSAENPDQLLQMDDQPLDGLELQEEDFITKEEFEEVWRTKFMV